MRKADELQRYFLMLDEGKGTAYERYALNYFMEELVKRLDIRTVLELPANGVMGVPGIKSVILAKCGCEVTLVNPSAKAIEDMKLIWDSLGLEATFIVSDYEATDLPASSYDLVWNFCVFEHFSNPDAVVAEMARLAKKYVLIEIQNVFNLGFPIHRLYHKITGEPWDHGELNKMKWPRVSELYKKHGLEIMEVDGTDMPPWPDINMKLGEAKDEKMDFTHYGDAFAQLRPSVKPKSPEAVAADWKSVGDNPPAFNWWMHILKIWFLTIEKFSPRAFRTFIAHHPYVIGKKK